MIELVPATGEMLRVFYPDGLRQSVRALAAVRDGEVLGIVGVYPADGRQAVFMEVKDELRKHPRVFIRGARIVMQWIRNARMPTHAMCDQSIEAAERFLVHYGFRHLHKGLYEWAPPQYR